MRATGLVTVDENNAGDAFFRESTRPAPHNLYGRTQLLWGFGGTPVPPEPKFEFQKYSDFEENGASFTGEPVASFHVRLDMGYDMAYVWDAAKNGWNRFQQGIEPFMAAGFPGVMVYASVNGVPLHDSRFIPLWERANERGAVVHIHPNYPAGVEAMQEYWLMPLVGFMFDTTLAAAGLVFAGIPRRFPRIRWVLGHLGGAIPYLAERLDRGFEAYPECRVNIDLHPSEYLRHFHYDTVNFDPRALRLAVEFAGPTQLLAGSDYPHLISSLAKMKESISAMPVSAAEKALILGGNAARLYGISA